MAAKNKGGRPTRFNKRVQGHIEMMARRGFTDKEMSEILGVTEQTFNNWKKKHPKFFESLKDWKALADKNVERSLYERACGYEHPDIKFATHEGMITDQVEFTRHYPPDPTSMIFWLKNRQPGKWRDKHDHQHTGEGGGPVIFNIEGVKPGDKPKDT
jgi:DNA-binding XRE family transcriptional regulator